MHVGQSEYRGGARGRGYDAQARRQQGDLPQPRARQSSGSILRCKGFIDGFAGSVEVMPVDSDPKKAGEAIAKKLAEDTGIDVALALNASIAGEPAVAAAGALRSPRKVRIGSFDVTPGILKAVAEEAQPLRSIQQPFLQGYLPVQYLTLLERVGVIPVSNVSTGPRLITVSEARKRSGLERGGGWRRRPAGPGSPTARQPPRPAADDSSSVG
jgi:simple sugar transport system substrate-binding protein